MKIVSKALNSIPRPILIKLSYWVRPVIALFLKGSNYTDPIDGRSYRKFLPYGYETIRENVLAPGTLSLERHRLFWLYLKNEIGFFSNLKKTKLLHFAPEQAFYSRFKKIKHLEYITTDLNSPLADVKADICKLPFKDNEFDYIFCNHVLEHIPDDTKAMQELYRVLAPGGIGIFQIPQELSREITFEDNSIKDPKERAKIFGQYDHVRVYGRDYFNKLRSIGFEVTEVDYTKTLSDKDINKFRLAKGEIIPVCKKN
ncbi:MAG: SAM-dependent methyltransferase [Flavobacteriaceae bacterium]